MTNTLPNTRLCVTGSQRPQEEMRTLRQGTGMRYKIQCVTCMRISAAAELKAEMQDLFLKMAEAFYLKGSPAQKWMELPNRTPQRLPDQREGTTPLAPQGTSPILRALSSPVTKSLIHSTINTPQSP